MKPAIADLNSVKCRRAGALYKIWDTQILVDIGIRLIASGFADLAHCTLSIAAKRMSLSHISLPK